MDDARDWKFYLKRHEADWVLPLLKKAKKLDEERMAISDKLHRVRNRCMHRRRFKIGNITDTTPAQQG